MAAQVPESEFGPSQIPERQSKQILPAGRSWLPFEFIFERLDDLDLAQCALICHEWRFLAKREWQFRSKEKVGRWTILREDWEKQHAGWKVKRAQLTELEALDLDEGLSELFYFHKWNSRMSSQSLAAVNEIMEELYERGAGTFAFERDEDEFGLMSTMAECWICEKSSDDALSEAGLMSAHLIRRLIGMGPAMKTSRRKIEETSVEEYVGLPQMIVQLLLTGRLLASGPKLSARHLKIVFDFLLEPMAVVSADFAIHEDYSLFDALFQKSAWDPENWYVRQLVIDLLIWCGLGDEWTRCNRDGESCREFFNSIDYMILCKSRQFWDFFMADRLKAHREKILLDAQSAFGESYGDELFNRAKGILSTSQSRKVFIEQLQRYSTIRDLVIDRFPSALFKLARMRERKILRVFLKLERGRLLTLRDDQGNCLLLYVAGCRGCISGIVSDLAAAGFDPHRRNLHHQTACDRYKMTSKVGFKQGVCMRNFDECADARSAAACD